MYTFEANGKVTWRDPNNGENGKGKWTSYGHAMRIKWDSGSIDEWKLPLDPSKQSGSTKMDGKYYVLRATRV